jgi:hypothetical protein
MLCTLLGSKLSRRRLRAWHNVFEPIRLCCAVQAEFSEHHEGEVGNEAIVKGLIELRKFWDALEGDFRIEAGTDDEDDKKTRTHTVNHGVGIICPRIQPDLHFWVLSRQQHSSAPC